MTVTVIVDIDVPFVIECTVLYLWVSCNRCVVMCTTSTCVNANNPGGIECTMRCLSLLVVYVSWREQ